MEEKSESEVAQSCPTLATPWTAAYQAPPSMGFSRQQYWSGVPLPSPLIIFEIFTQQVEEVSDVALFIFTRILHPDNFLIVLMVLPASKLAHIALTLTVLLENLHKL